MPRVIHFEIHAEDCSRAVNFYKNVLGWEFQKWQGPFEYYNVSTGNDNEPGINGGLVKRRGVIDGTAVIAYVCTVDVSSVDEYAEKATSNGGQIVVPKMEIPGVGWLIYCKDTEGNIFGMMESI